MILFTPEGLESLAKASRTLGIKHIKLEVHKDDDTHGVIRLCCTEEAGWIDLEKGFYS